MPKITVYSTATCGYCRMLKSYLQNNHITYYEKHADLDPRLVQELYDKSGQLGVPFTVIQKEDGTEEKVLGFDKSRIDAILSLAEHLVLAGYP